MNDNETVLLHIGHRIVRTKVLHMNHAEASKYMIGSGTKIAPINPPTDIQNLQIDILSCNFGHCDAKDGSKDRSSLYGKRIDEKLNTLLDEFYKNNRQVDDLDTDTKHLLIILIQNNAHSPPSACRSFFQNCEYVYTDKNNEAEHHKQFDIHFSCSGFLGSQNVILYHTNLDKEAITYTDTVVERNLVGVCKSAAQELQINSNSDFTVNVKNSNTGGSVRISKNNVVLTDTELTDAKLTDAKLTDTVPIHNSDNNDNNDNSDVDTDSKHPNIKIIEEKKENHDSFDMPKVIHFSKYFDFSKKDEP